MRWLVWRGDAQPDCRRYLALHHKTQKKMVGKRMIIGYTPWAPQHAYTNRRCRNPARTQHNPVLRQRVVFMMTWGLINCGNAGDFGSVPGTLTHWRERRVNWWCWQTEKLMWQVFTKRDGEAVVAGFLELKARDISCSGWEVRTDLMW